MSERSSWSPADLNLPMRTSSGWTPTLSSTPRKKVPAGTQRNADQNIRLTNQSQAAPSHQYVLRMALQQTAAQSRNMRHHHRVFFLRETI